jgi:hypothetical protein
MSSELMVGSADGAAVAPLLAAVRAPEGAFRDMVMYAVVVFGEKVDSWYGRFLEIGFALFVNSTPFVAVETRICKPGLAVK